MIKPWQAIVDFNQRQAAAAYRYADIARDLYDASITPMARNYHKRSWVMASRRAASYSRDARALFNEWIGE